MSTYTAPSTPPLPSPGPHPEPIAENPKKSSLAWWLLGATVAVLVVIAAGTAALLALSDGTSYIEGSNPTVHSTEAGEPPLPQTESYRYADIGGKAGAKAVKVYDQQMARRNAQAMMKAPTKGPMYVGWSSHNVYRGSHYAGILLVEQINETYLGTDGLTPSELMWVDGKSLKQDGAVVTDSTLADQPVLEVVHDGMSILVWYDDGMVYVFMGLSPSDPGAFAEEAFAASDS